MPNVLKPDLKAAVWLLVGFVAVPKVMSMVRR